MCVWLFGGGQLPLQALQALHLSVECLELPHELCLFEGGREGVREGREKEREGRGGGKEDEEGREEGEEEKKGNYTELRYSTSVAATRRLTERC